MPDTTSPVSYDPERIARILERLRKYDLLDTESYEAVRDFQEEAANAYVPYLLSVIQGLKAENEALKSQEPDYVFHRDNWDATYPADDPSVLLDSLGCGEMIRIGRLKALPDKWAVRVPIDSDEEGFATNDEIDWYDSEEDAQAMVDSLNDDDDDCISTPPAQEGV